MRLRAGTRGTAPCKAQKRAVLWGCKQRWRTFSLGVARSMASSCPAMVCGALITASTGSAPAKVTKPIPRCDCLVASLGMYASCAGSNQIVGRVCSATHCCMCLASALPRAHAASGNIIGHRTLCRLNLRACTVSTLRHACEHTLQCACHVWG